MEGPVGEQRSGNPIARAVQVRRIATGEETDGRMGIFSWDIQVAPYGNGGLLPASRTARADVDTGAVHSVIPAGLLEGLGVQPFDDPIEVQYADDQTASLSWGLARILLTVEGHNYDKPCYVVFGEDEDIVLLGATTLEAFGLMVDSAAETLVPRTIRARPF